jgi:hypothetical protein
VLLDRTQEAFLKQALGIKQSADAPSPDALSDEDIRALAPGVLVSMLRDQANVIDGLWKGYWSSEDLLYHQEQIAEQNSLTGPSRNDRIEASKRAASLNDVRKPYEVLRAKLKSEYFPDVLKHMKECDALRARSIVLISNVERPEEDEKDAFFHSIENGESPISSEHVIWILNDLRDLANRLEAQANPPKLQ